MRWITLTLLLCFHNAFACQALIDQQMSFYQVMNVKKAFHYGKPHDLSYTLAAIIWQESSGGLNKYNPNDPSSGYFQILVDNAIVYANMEDTPANRVLISARLIEDFTLGAKFAVKNLQYWKKVYNDDWKLSVMSYNAGWNYQAGESYLSQIQEKVRIIKQCGWEG